MSNQLIDFESGSVATGDSGERTSSTAIKPYSDGESLDQTVLDRPHENMRARTEAVRKRVEDLLYQADADKWIITGGDGIGDVTGAGAAEFPTVKWNEVTGIFEISEAIVIQPLMAPNTDLYGSQVYSITDSIPTTVTFTFTANQFDYQLANQLQIIWEEAATGDISGGSCEATLEGSPAHILRIVIRDDGLTQGTNIDTALGLILPAAAVDYVMGGIGSTYVALSDITDTDVVVKGTYSRELHHLLKTTLATYFLAPGNDLSVDGDGIGIWFEDIVDPVLSTFGGRRQATPRTAPTPNTEVTVAKLFKFSTEPEKIYGAIPLCRRIGTSLVFVDGTVVNTGQTTQFGQQPWQPFLSDQAGADAGNTLIGCDAVTDTPSSLIAGTQREQTVELLGHVNDRATLVELAQVVDDRVKAYDLRAADPEKMMSTGLWVEPWALPGDAANVITGGSTKQYVDMATIFSATGEPQLIVADNGALKFEIWDPRTLSLLDTSDAVTDDLPAGTYTIQSICTDGVSVYATLRNTDPIPDEYYIQAWDIATWAVKAGWYAVSPTGTQLTLTVDSKFYKCIVANDTRIAVINNAATITANTDPVVEIINIDTGAIVVVGAGNSTPTGGGSPDVHIASDGTYVYFGVYEGGLLYVCNASIADPTVSSGGPGFGTGVAALAAVGGVVSIGVHIVMFLNYATQDKTDIVVLMMDNSAAYLDVILRGLLQSTHTLGADAFVWGDVGDAVFDGLNVWAFATVEMLSAGNQAVLCKLDASKFCPSGPTLLDVQRVIVDLFPSVFMFPPGHSGLGVPLPFIQEGMTFDGRDVWAILEHNIGQPLTGGIGRLPLALIRN